MHIGLIFCLFLSMAMSACMLENICMHGMTLHVRRFKEIKVQCRALQKLAAFWH